MYQITVIYNTPTDPQAFDEYYETTHLPLVGAIPGLQHFSMGKCESMDDTTPAAYALAQLSFESKRHAGEALGSPAGQAAAGDVANFATGGATMLFSDDTTVGP